MANKWKEIVESEIQKIGWSLRHAGCDFYVFVNHHGAETDILLETDKIRIQNKPMFGHDGTFEDYVDFGSVVFVMDEIEIRATSEHAVSFVSKTSPGCFLKIRNPGDNYRKPEEDPGLYEPIHEWFELTYAQYLTVPRSVLQSMPVQWQSKFVELLEELDNTIDWRPDSGCYWVRLRDSAGRFVHDPLMDYQRGRRKIEHKSKTDQ